MEIKLLSGNQNATELIVKILRKSAIPVSLLFIFYLAFSLRATPAFINAPWLPQYDSYWFYRYAKMVVDNNGVMPAWDPLSYYPPGRPSDVQETLYIYFLAYTYMLWHSIEPAINLIQSCKWIATFLVSLSIFPAYFIGKYFSGKRAGLLTALFIAVSPSILIRTGADADNDGSVIFFTMLCFYLFIRLFKEPNLKNTAFAALGLSLFAMSWFPFWYVIFICVSSLFLNLIISGAIATYRKNKEMLDKTMESVRQKLIYSMGVIAGVLVIPRLFGVDSFNALMGFLSFGTNPLGVILVNISVAELQRLDIFSLSGWGQILARTPGLTFLNNLELEIFLFLVLFSFAIYTTYKKDGILGSLLLIWTAFTFYAISSGIRFTLLFAPAACVAIGVALGELWRVVDEEEGLLYKIKNKLHIKAS